jgi:hypothetical protein
MRSPIFSVSPFGIVRRLKIGSKCQAESNECQIVFQHVTENYAGTVTKTAHVLSDTLAGRLHRPGARDN